MYFWRHLGNRLTGKYLVNKEVFRTFGEAEEILYRDTDGLNSKMRVYLTPDEVFEILRKEKGRKYFKKEKFTINFLFNSFKYPSLLSYSLYKN